MAETIIIPQIGPASHGTRMTLDEFSRVEGRPGYIYELEKGVIVVVDVPGVPHAFVRQVLRDALVLYRAAHSKRVCLIAHGSDAALRIPGLQSERHPDICVYLTAPPEDEAQPWDFWTPEIVVEIVSASSADRDYTIKPDEYLRAGVRLYWIVDPRSRVVTEFTRRGDQWCSCILKADQLLRTSLLPGFELRVAELFAAVR